MADPLERVRDEVADHLEQIKSLFKPGAKISVFVRWPHLPDRDFILTDDDLNEVVEMIDRRDPTRLANAAATGGK